jgi:hypothetical protein
MCGACDGFGMFQQDKGCSSVCGPVAQRLHGMEELTGSIPIRSIHHFNNLRKADVLVTPRGVPQGRLKIIPGYSPHKALLNRRSLHYDPANDKSGLQPSQMSFGLPRPRPMAWAGIATRVRR